MTWASPAYTHELSTKLSLTHTRTNLIVVPTALTQTLDTLSHHTVTLPHTRSHTGRVRGCLPVSRLDAHRRG